MAAQTDGLLIHGGLIAKDSGFCQHTGVINVAILQDDLEFLVQAVSVVLYPACAQSFHLADALFQKHKTAFHVCLHLGALGGAHLHKAIQCLSCHGGNILPQLLFVHISVAGGQHIREAGQHTRRDIVLDAQLLGDIPHGLLVTAGQFHVDGDHGIRCVHVLHGHAKLYLAAGDPLVELLFQAAVQRTAGARDAGGILEIAGVHAAQFHSDLAAIEHGSPSAETGHA